MSRYSNDIALKNWNSGYAVVKSEKPPGDDWIQNHIRRIRLSRHPILDLGCGAGGNALALKEKGHIPVCGDYAIEALRTIRSKAKEIPVVLFDMREGLPFKKGYFNIIMADLTLHYFDTATTFRILDAIRDILAENGTLLCRVNSIKDKNHGAGIGDEIEHHYYSDKGRLKRFFDYDDVQTYFNNLHIESCGEYSTFKYGPEKKIWEIICKKII
jgi:SAM-dependent methyltransferase